jgi:hypothetical protein
MIDYACVGASAFALARKEMNSLKIYNDYYKREFSSFVF